MLVIRVFSDRMRGNILPLVTEEILKYDVYLQPTVFIVFILNVMPHTARTEQIYLECNSSLLLTNLQNYTSCDKMNKFTELKSDANESIDFTKTEQALLRLSRSLLDFWRSYDQQTPMGNISWNEYYYIDALRDNPLSLKELAQKVGVKTSSASAMVSKLEQRKMISRLSSEQDRRMVHLQLTPEAKAQLALEWNVYQKFLSNLQQHMPADEFATLCNLLIKSSRYF